jgi:hypothetical protein
LLDADASDEADGGGVNPEASFAYAPADTEIDRPAFEGESELDAAFEGESELDAELTHAAASVDEPAAIDQDSIAPADSAPADHADDSDDSDDNQDHKP